MNKEFEMELAGLINKYSLEHSLGDTPDFIVAKMVVGFLLSLGEGLEERSNWYCPDNNLAVKATQTGTFFCPNCNDVKQMVDCPNCIHV